MQIARLAAVAALLTPVIAAAATAAVEGGKPLTAEEFDALSVGRTFFYSSGGRPYGAEQYLPGRKVVWAFLGDDCRKGEWYEDNGYICFLYGDTSDPQCWTFYSTPEGITARFRDDPEGAPLVAVQQSPAPLACLGPDVGV
ncbi:MAG: hypothetical protein ACOY4T_08455 [Pseudomonadota bacterium]